MVAEPKPELVSVDEYLRMEAESEERHEYIDGRVYALAGGTATHSLTCVGLLGVLAPLLRGSGCMVFTSDMRVRLSATRYVYPDVTVSCDPADAGATINVRSPRAIFEVLSQSTESYDRGRKFDWYRELATVLDYVLVRADERRIEVYHRGPDSWIYRAYGPGEEVSIEGLEIRFPVDDVYADIPPLYPGVEI